MNKIKDKFLLISSAPEDLFQIYCATFLLHEHQTFNLFVSWKTINANASKIDFLSAQLKWKT